MVGRAGRPGVGTEGRALVLLLAGETGYRHTQARLSYQRLVDGLSAQSGNTKPAAHASSPLAELLRAIWNQWIILAGNDDADAFYRWLEVTAPLEYDSDEETVPDAVSSLDTLDSIIISALVETEQLAREPLSPNDLEGKLQRIWQRSYARFAADQHENLGSMFLHRGNALVSSIYPDRGQRRQLYMTSLAPRAGEELLGRYGEVRETLREGSSYANWGVQDKLAYVTRIVTLIGSIRKFRYDARARTQPVDVEDVLAWWLLPASLRNFVAYGTSRKVPKHKQAPEWVRYINSNLIYRFAWGLGSMLSLAIDEVHGGQLKPSRIEDWPKTGLPWISFWLKELITWGTLDPVAAFLLSRNRADTRTEAEEKAGEYYRQCDQVGDPNEKLDARRVRDWVVLQGNVEDDFVLEVPPKEINSRLLRDFSKQEQQTWRVLPVEQATRIIWYDPAGFA